ncbi:hypothetical protein AAU57_06990 [Nonlabens sp. YIK11]|uniref:hypothetical protein n=1 Tax=Nonlabens sp. YIK11 TaxID=1453349 RepID=UPI0006DCCDF3|nr:hypothetical protein [Nonlabens sp. YIK11]KQC33089.1 hypothetical protein AAU57_06990 [Nonlabens sp. YIK11]
MIRNLLSLKIQLAQSRISVQDAKGLGIVSFLAYLNVKVESSRHSASKSKYPHQLPGVVSKQELSELVFAINDFIHLLKLDVTNSKSLERFIQVDQCLRFETSAASTVSQDLLDKISLIENAANKYFSEFRSHFSDRICAVQSMTIIRNGERTYGLEAKDLVKTSSILEILSHLTLNTSGLKRPKQLHSSPVSQSVLYKSAV